MLLFFCCAIAIVAIVIVCDRVVVYVVGFAVAVASIVIFVTVAIYGVVAVNMRCC